MRFCISVCLLAGCGWIAHVTLMRGETSSQIRVAARCLIDHDYGNALHAVQGALGNGAEGDFVHLVAGLVMAGVHDSSQAIWHFEQVTDADRRLSLIANRELAIRHFRLGRMTEAEKFFRAAIKLQPDDMDTCREFSDLLVLQGRTWEALPLVHRLFRQGLRQKQQVLKAAAIDGTFAVNEAFNSLCLQACPDDPIVCLVNARRDLLKNRVDAARANLEKIIEVYPDLTEAQVRLGRVLLKSNGTDFLIWHRRYGSQCEAHPEIWCLRGLFCEENGHATHAIRFYLEALRLYPDHQEANARLSQLLGHYGHAEIAERFGQRAKDVGQMVYLSSELSGKPRTPMILESAELMFRMGRFWEAAGWCETYMNFFDVQDQWALSFLDRVRPHLVNPDFQTASPSWVSDSLIEEFPIADIEDFRIADDGRSVVQQNELPSGVSFHNVASNVGLDFRYVNGGKSSGGLEHMLQSTGGGVGVLDFDLDSWPDLYFAQSNNRFGAADNNLYVDTLYRNVRGQKVSLCTGIAMAADAEFSQGVGCSDWNADGFPDLFVANVGGNRLYLNNGDGTFSENTPPQLSTRNEWTLSAAFGDLDSDGLSDLYVVNYLVLEEVLARQCKRDNRPMGCAPTMFPAEQDRLYLNTGNGSVDDITSKCGIVVEDGKGLGVVIADIDNAGGLEVFVGNDTTANFLFQRDASRGQLRFRDIATFSGVAFDEGGNAQSCMGIGLDDANNDGLLDLFVTNFYADSNTLYLQTAPNFFRDATRDCNLRDSGFNMLGFGCQFLDADLDGWRDLVVTNGHVDRTFATGAPDAMPPQFFYNEGHGKYTELPAAGLGNYFQREALGRTVVLLDWNQDGAEDFCVSHLDRPAALLQNSATTRGAFLQVQVIGTTAERIPIGTRVEVRSGSRVLTRQLVGGGGYEGANTPILTFGLGKVESVDVDVTWPDGSSGHYPAIGVPARIAIVQGRKHTSSVAQ